MNTHINTPPKSPRHLPNVGELWHHKDDNVVHLRILDREGRCAIEDTQADAKDFFYSVNLEDGGIYRTSITSDDIEILRPVGGTLELEHV